MTMTMITTNLSDGAARCSKSRLDSQTGSCYCYEAGYCNPGTWHMLEDDGDSIQGRFLAKDTSGGKSAILKDEFILADAHYPGLKTSGGEL